MRVAAARPSRIPDAEPAPGLAVRRGTRHRARARRVATHRRVDGRRRAAAGPWPAGVADAGGDGRAGAGFEPGLAAAGGAHVLAAPGRAGVDVRRPGPGHRRTDRAVRALLP